MRCCGESVCQANNGSVFFLPSGFLLASPRAVLVARHVRAHPRAHGLLPLRATAVCIFQLRCSRVHCRPRAFRLTRTACPCGGSFCRSARGCVVPRSSCRPQDSSTNAEPCSIPPIVQRGACPCAVHALFGRWLDRRVWRCTRIPFGFAGHCRGVVCLSGLCWHCMTA